MTTQSGGIGINKKDVIVVGGGVGGTAAGALLAKSGFDTLLLEKNEGVGGCCTRIERNGFEFDAAVHVFGNCEKGPHGEVTRRIGLEKELQFIQKDEFIVGKAGNTEASMPPLWAESPEETFTAHVNFFEEFGVPIRELIPKKGLSNFKQMLKDMWNLNEKQIQERNLYQKSLIEFSTEYGVNPALLLPLLGWSVLFAVAPPWNVSAGEFIRSYQTMITNATYGYAKGGAAAIPETFAKGIEKNNGKVKTKTEVEKILVKDGETKGVELKDGTTIKSEIVVSNSGPKRTVFDLVGEDYFPEEYVEKVKKIRNYGMGGCEVIRIALDKKVIEHPSVLGFGRSEKAIKELVKILGISNTVSLHPCGITEFIDRIWEGEQRENLSFCFGRLWEDEKTVTKLGDNIRNLGFGPIWMTIPTYFDPSLAPEGKQIIQAGGIKGTTYDYIVDLYPEVEKHTLWYDTMDSSDLEKHIGKWGGPIISNPLIVSQSGDERLQNETPIEGLYFAGDNAGGHGIGTELASRSAIQCSELIKEKH